MRKFITSAVAIAALAAPSVALASTRAGGNGAINQQRMVDHPDRRDSVCPGLATP
ncbi:MAG: hypothetical protein ACXWQ5_18510 [Ktedonobacterales bacterium]